MAGPLDTEAIGDLDLSTHVMDGKYAVPRPSSVHKFLCGLASWWIEMLIADETIKVDGTNCSRTLPEFMSQPAIGLTQSL